MKPVGLLLISVITAGVGQILFKRGVLAIGEVTFRSSVMEGLIRLIFRPSIFSGLVLYAVSTVFWLIALSKTTLNFAYPFTILTFAVVMIASRVIFMEYIPPLRYFGFFLICVGILLSSLAKG